MSEIVESILCNTCGNPLKILAGSQVAKCLIGHQYQVTEGVLEYTPAASLAALKEVAARDGQAQSYLSHRKVPVHAARFREFCEQVPSSYFDNQLALDLGCGPGPTTSVLLSKGCGVIAVDFSMQSLMLNRGDNPPRLSQVVYVRADLNSIRFAENAATILVMSDFLQHLGDRSTQRDFLHAVFRSLRPGGMFYLSFFNINLKNLVKSDTHGTWSGISYVRNRVADVIAMLPDDILVSRRVPMNLSYQVSIDQVLSQLPFADWFSRWILLTGYRRFSG